MAYSDCLSTMFLYVAYTVGLAFVAALSTDKDYSHSFNDPRARDVRHFPVPKEHVGRNWIKSALEELEWTLHHDRNTGVAKNVIFFLGDGMSLGTVWATRIYEGQYMKGQSGEENVLEFEKFPNIGLYKTYAVNHQTTESAAAGCAYLTGVKCNFNCVGVTESVKYNNCSNENEHKTTSLVDWSHDEGKWTGVITNTRITHASPGNAYAHTANRDWECDSDINADNTQYNCKDIAKQLVEENSNIRVVMGGGRAKFIPKTMQDPEYPSKNGSRSDGRDLTKEWENKHASEGHSYKYVWNKQQFDAIDPEKTDYIFGLFEPSHMQYEIDRTMDMEPSLTEMTEKSIRLLRRSEKGFFLFIESGRIDHGHHDANARRALDEGVELNRAVKKALELVDTKETLIIVTADHSFSFMATGYTGRGNDILGIVDTDYIEPAWDNLPQLVLSYGGGPAGLNNAPRRDVTNDDTTHKDYIQQALFGSNYAIHSGEDVPLYAIGPMAHLFNGVHEQNYIAVALGYASCVGPERSHCKEQKMTRSERGSIRKRTRKFKSHSSLYIDQD